MKNVAYSDEYKVYRKEQEKLFCDEYLHSSDRVVLSHEYYIKQKSYIGKVGGYSLHGTENELYNGFNEMIYRWQNINDDCEFFKIIEHSNGHSYLVFRSELYGYSVLDLTTRQSFQFVPDGSFPSGETFIWTDVFYNSSNNLLAVSGCYWACPMGTLIVDFSEPLTEPRFWVDVQAKITDGYDIYDDLDFVEWRGEDLVLSAYNNEKRQNEPLILTKNDYSAWLS